MAVIDVGVIQRLAKHFDDAELLILREEGFMLVQIANTEMMQRQLARRLASLPEEERKELIRRINGIKEEIDGTPETDAGF